MNVRPRIISAGALAAAATLTACTGQQMPLPRYSLATAKSHRAARIEAPPETLFFVADNFDNEVDIFAQSKPKRRIATITRGIASPTGVAVDNSNDLYVANGSTNSITVYAPPYTARPIRTYAGGFSDPVGVAVGGNGAVYVSDYADGLLVKFAPHRTKPSHVIPLTGRPTGIALNVDNDLFVAYQSYADFSGVLEFKSGSTRFTDLGIRVGFAGGIAFDSSGNLVLEDELAQSVNVYPPGSTIPSRVITNGFLNPVSLAFNAAQNRLYVADAGALDVDTLSYPEGKPIARVTGFDAPEGVALTPPAPK